MNLSTVWSFVSGICVMSIAWIYGTHAELSCPQKSMIIFLAVLASTSLAIGFTLIKEASR